MTYNTSHTSNVLHNTCISISYLLRYILFHVPTFNTRCNILFHVPAFNLLHNISYYVPIFNSLRNILLHVLHVPTFMSVGWDVKWCHKSRITTPLARKRSFLWIPQKSRLVMAARETPKYLPNSRRCYMAGILPIRCKTQNNQSFNHVPTFNFVRNISYHVPTLNFLHNMLFLFLLSTYHIIYYFMFPLSTSCRTVALRKKNVDRPECYSVTHSKNCIFIAQTKLRTVWT